MKEVLKKFKYASLIFICLGLIIPVYSIEMP